MTTVTPFEVTALINSDMMTAVTTTTLTSITTTTNNIDNIATAAASGWPYPSSSTNMTLEEVNDARATTLVPAMLVLACLMVVGISGNVLVCYVFCCRLKSGTQNFLIVCLAVFDLLSCIIGIPNEIADMRFYYMFESVAACKIMRFINTFTAIGSIFTLLVIAIDRYRKICKPFFWQLRMRHVRLSLIPIVGGALFFAWPAFVMYGLRTTETFVPGLIGKDCSTPDGIGKTAYPLIYNSTLFLCFIILTVTLLIIYCLVLRETKRHNRYMKRNSDFNLPSSGQYDSSSSVDNTPVACGSPSAEDGKPISAQNGRIDYRPDPVATIEPVFIYITDTDAITTATSTTAAAAKTAGISTITPLGLVFDPDIGSNEDLSNEDSEPKLLKNSKDEDGKGEEGEEKGYDNKGMVSTVDETPQVPNSPEYDSDYPEVFDSERKTVTFPEQDDDLAEDQRRPSLPDHPSCLVKNGHKGDKHDIHVAILAPRASISTEHSISLKKKKRRLRSKTTIIAFLVTLVFILSFLPHLSLQVAKLIVKGFDYDLRGSALVAYNIFLRSYFINSVSNPIIYGVLNVQFASEVKTLMKKLYSKVKIC